MTLLLLPGKATLLLPKQKVDQRTLLILLVLSQPGTSDPWVRSGSSLSPALLLVSKRSNPALLLSTVHCLMKPPSHLPEVHLSSRGP